MMHIDLRARWRSRQDGYTDAHNLGRPSGQRCVVRYQTEMPTESPTVIEIEHKDGVCILRLKGRFVAGTDPEYVLAKLKEIKDGACGMVLVDLREVSAIGSMGLGFLVGLYISI